MEVVGTSRYSPPSVRTIVARSPWTLGNLGLIAFVTLVLFPPGSVAGSGSSEPGVAETRGDRSFVVHVSYGAEFEGTCDPITVTVHFHSEVEGGVPPYRYSWGFGDGGVSSDPEPSHTYTDISVRYSVTLGVTDANGTVASDSLALRPPPPPCAILLSDNPWRSPWTTLAIGVATTIIVLGWVVLRRRMIK